MKSWSFLTLSDQRLYLAAYKETVDENGEQRLDGCFSMKMERAIRIQKSSNSP